MDQINKKFLLGKYRNYSNKLLDWIFPRRCPVCDRIVTPVGQLICKECFSKIKYIKEPKCQLCGKEIQDSRNEDCFDCTNKTHFFTKGIGLFEYESMRESIYRFKYASRCEYAAFYGEAIVLCLGDIIKSWNPDGIIPVPLYKAKLKKRGYNQAELVANEIGKKMGINVYSDFVVRIKKTVPQKELDGKARQNNLKKAFKIRPNDVKLETIILIDDIYTTGSTIDSISLELRSAGIKNIYFVALSIGNGM